MHRRYDPRVDRWSALPLDDVAARIEGTSAWLSGGVALDHWLGRSTRRHGDTDVSVTESGWHELRARLEPSLHAYSAQSGWLSPAEANPSVNTWFADDDGMWRLQVNLESGDDASWRYRRDQRIALPWAEAVLDVDGIRTGAPEVQLLWKLREPSRRDAADIRRFLPLLPVERAEWLRAAVALAHP